MAATTSTPTTKVKMPGSDVVDSVAREMVVGLRTEVQGYREESKAEYNQIKHDLSTGFSLMTTRFDKSQAEMTARFDSAKTSEVQSVTSKSGLLIGAAVGIIGLAFTFTGIVTQPLRDGEARQCMEVKDMRSQAATDLKEIRAQAAAELSELRTQASIHAAQLVNDALERGKLMEHAEANRLAIERTAALLTIIDSQVHSDAVKLGEHAGQLELLRENTRDMDMNGSRKWVQRPTTPAP